MNRDKMLKQAQILRRKRNARVLNAQPKLNQGVIKLDTPLNKDQMPNAAQSPNPAEIRRRKAERILQSRQELYEKNKQKQARQAAARNAASGCGRCNRKKG